MNTKRSSTNPGAAPAVAVAYLPTDGTGRGGCVIFDTKDDAKNNDLLDAFVDSHNEWQVSKFLVRLAQTGEEHQKQRADAAVERAERAVRRVNDLLSGRAVFNGPVRAELAHNGVWLLDPVKRGAGLGLHFPDLDAVWKAFPQLRPTSWGADEGGAYMTLEPWTLELEQP